jgi:hypothetical protein
MNELNHAYLAGIFDSDGSFSVAKRNMKRSSASYVAMVQLNWKATELTKSFMDKLVEKFGGSYCFCKSTNKKTTIKTSDYYSFSATGKSAENIVRAVLPFLQLKKQQALNLLELRDTIPPVGTKGRSKETSEKLEHLYVVNKILNTKNGTSNA